ncbi:MAG: HEAT repeat domain-containing protein [Candidatus Aminicenantes bacterium]|nr:MAG: HEAT repeat domain-containing protein [Candidatus Aminicenantes bacterium]
MRKTAAVIAVVILAFVQALPGQTADYSKKALQSEGSGSFDALHYLVKIALDLDRKSFAGTATVTASSFVEGLESCVLDAEEYSLGAFYQDVFRKDGSVRVRAEALRALGLTGDASLVPFLRESAATPSHQNMIRRAAEEALKQLGK